MTASAATISRKLRAAGFNPIGSGSTREGIHVRRVSRQGGVHVGVHIDNDTAADRMTDAVHEALTDMGYDVRRRGHHLYL